MINVKSIHKDFANIVERTGLTEREAKSILVQAVNRSAIAVRQEAIRLIRNRYHVRTTDLRKAVNIRKANKHKIVATISSRGSVGIPLYRFRVGRRVPSTYWRGSVGHKKAMPIGGIKVHVRKSAGKKQITGGFVAKMKSGHIGVFQRKPGTKMYRSNREQLTEKFGPSPEKMYYDLSEYQVEALDDKSEEILQRNILSGLKYFLGKK